MPKHWRTTQVVEFAVLDIDVIPYLRLDIGFLEVGLQFTVTSIVMNMRSRIEAGVG